MDLAEISDLNQAVNNLEEISDWRLVRDIFWQEVYSRISENKGFEFLQTLVNSVQFNKYDIKTALAAIPKNWLNKASIKRNWKYILNQFSQRFALDLSNPYTLEYFFEDIWGAKLYMVEILDGILEGLSINSDLANAENFFNFINIARYKVSPEQAFELLDFSLSRFELHVDENFADGEWDAWLSPPPDINESFAGFVWASLGSPRTETRWRAAHCVRRLADTNCQRQIIAIVDWMNKDSIGAFGCNKHPFYFLHAQQYLLMALARISIDKPNILYNARKFLLNMLLTGFLIL